MSRDREFYQTEYIKGNKSIRQIAAEQKTYPAKIFREIKTLEIPIKSKQDVQKERLKHIEHPTKGKQRTEAERIKIGESMAGHWASLTDEEAKSRVNNNLVDFKKLPKKERDHIQKLANQEIKRTAKKGSKAENYILQKLIADGYNVVFHKELPIRERLIVDLILSSYNIVIEVDGISHHEPIWGEAKLAQQQKADRDKNAILVSNGYTVVRFKLTHRNYNLTKLNRAFLKLKIKIDELIKERKPGVIQYSDEAV